MRQYRFFVIKGEQLLLKWRDDEFYGQGWHILGGCLRMKETMDKRIQETAIDEIGTEVVYDSDSLITREVMVNEDRLWLKNQLERSHNISILFDCHLPNEFDVKNKATDKHTAGFLKWFDKTPSNLLEAHKTLYGDIIDSFFKGELKWKT